MESKQPDDVSDSTPAPPNFLTDFMNATISTVFTVLLWLLFFQYYQTLRLILPLFFGISLGTLGATLIVFFFSYSVIVRWFEVLGYKMASWRTGVPYMNYRSRCPFLQRRYLNFSCRAEQIKPFEVNIFEKCHHKPMWEMCWPERIPSILEMYDDAPTKIKQQYAFILAAMKEYALPAGDKMLEALTNDALELEARVSAGYALEEMKNEKGIEPLIPMIGQFEQRTDNMIRAILVRYQEMALPYLINAVQDCSDDDYHCGGIIEVLGKMKHETSIPTLKTLLTSDSTGEYSRLQTIYALKEVGNEEAFGILITYLENAPDDDQMIIKQVILEQKLVSFPLLIDLLSNQDITEEYYAIVGDILAEVDANTYDSFFTKLLEIKGPETVQRLATILKENTPEDEEFIRIQEVLSKHISFSPTLENSSELDLLD